MNLLSLVVGHLLSSFDKQLHLSDLVGTPRWNFDLPNRRLSFGTAHYWHAEILGTESRETNTWLWAWANTVSNVPPALIQASLQMKQLGEPQQIVTERLKLSHLWAPQTRPPM